MIPMDALEAAEEAVIDAMIKYGPDGHIDGYQEIARAALEAAAPYMLAQVWQDAYGQGVEDERTSAAVGADYGPNRNNPYRSQA